MNKYFEMPAGELLNKLQVGAQFTQSKSTLPVLSMALFARSINGTLAFASTNLEAGVVVDTGIPILNDKSIAVPARTMIEILRGMTGVVKVEIDDRISTLVLKGGGSKTELKCLPGEKFPPMKYSQIIGRGEAQKSTIAYDGKKLAAAIDFVGSSASSDNARPVLSGVYMEYGGFTCADGFRLAHMETDVVGSKENPKALVNASLLASVTKSFGDTVTVLIYDGLAVFQCGAVEYFFGRIEGAYPDYTQIYPKQTANLVHVAKGDLARILRTAKVMAPDSRLITVDILDGAITVKAQNEETGYFDETLACDTELPNGPFKLAVKVDFLAEAVAKFPDSLLTLHASAATNPIVLKSDHPDYRNAYHVVMPMHLSGE
jgi:DNA polymerase III sliding clamp (beta) subunit (PCNA family)